MKELKLDNQTIDKVSKILNKKNELIQILNSNNKNILIKSIIKDIGYDLILDLINIYEFKNDCSLIDLINIIEEYKLKNIPIFLSDLDINGNDIKSMGFSGKQIGYILNILLNEVHKDESLNKKNKLIQKLKEIETNIN